MIRELGLFERALYLSDQHAPFNVIGVLQLENPPEPEILQRALELLQKRHPFLMAHIPEAVQPVFEAMAQPELPLKVITRTSSAQWVEIVEWEMNRRIDISSGPLFRSVYLLGKGQAEIIFTFHHAIMDAISGMTFLDELLQLCVTLQTGQQFELPPLTPLPAVEKRFPSAFKGVWRIFPTLRYAFSQISDELGYRWRMRGKRIPQVNPGGSGHIFSLTLSEGLVNQLSQRARKKKVTLNSLLNAALLLAVNRYLYNAAALPMRTMVFADLRPYTVPPTPRENLGNYISMMRYTVDISGGRDIWDIAGELHPKIYASLKHGDKFIAAMMSEQLMKMMISTKSMRMAATALNYSGEVPLEKSYGGIKVVGLHAFNSVLDLAPEFFAQARLFNDQLWWDFMYRDSDMDPELAESIVREVASILENAVQSPA